VTGTSAGSQSNTTGAVTSTEGGTGATSNTAVLTVIAPPAIAKAFNPTSIAVNATTELTFTITNPPANTAPLTGVGFSDTLPTGLTVANNSASTCGGTLTTTAPTGIALTGATIAVSSQCQFSVTVTGTAVNNYTNTTGNVTSTNGGTGNQATANLRVITCVTSFTVNDNGDADDATPGDGICATSGGVCTLRAAIKEVNAVSSCGDFTINFSLSTPNTITLNTALPNLAHNVTITGPGVNLLTVQRSTGGGTSEFRISTITTGTTVNISGLTISNGSVSDPIGGGAIYNDRGTLTITNCAFNQNSATTGGAIYNSGIFGTANLTIINSTFSQNSATSGIGQGGAIYSHGHDGAANLIVLNSTFSQNSAREAGGILNVATNAGGTASLKVFNSTFSQNTATTGLSNGGALANAGDFGGTATATVINSTLSQNSANNGGAIFNFQNAGTATLQMGNTILKKGTSGANFSNNDTLISVGHNLSDDAAGGDATTGPGGLLNQPGDKRNTDPLLGPLANNGGPTQTHVLLPGSPAIDAGSNALAVDQNSNPLTTDQRGAGFPRIINSTVDIGAYELQEILRIDNVNPPAGRTSGGQQISLTGAFANLSTVTMGGVAASWVYTNGGGDTSAITVTTPAHAVGAVQIDLTPLSGNPYSKANAFAYLPTVFTDNTLTVGVTTAKAQHIIELREAVDAMRAVAGLGPAPWTDPTLSPTSTIIKAVHILELRTYLDNAASLLGYATSAYTDPSLTTGFVIKKVHIEELRQRIRTIAG
jgi:CSLREA domain-containing protein